MRKFPPTFSSPLRVRHWGDPARVPRSGPLNLRRKGATRTSMGPPPKLSLGWIWALGKTAHFSGTQALPPVIPHEGTKLGAPSQRWGMGWSYQTHTHTRTGSETKGKNKAQLDPLRLHRLNHYPIGVWGQCL